MPVAIGREVTHQEKDLIERGVGERSSGCDAECYDGEKPSETNYAAQQCFSFGRLETRDSEYVCLSRNPCDNVIKDAGDL